MSGTGTVGDDLRSSSPLWCPTRLVSVEAPAPAQREAAAALGARSRWPRRSSSRRRSGRRRLATDSDGERAQLQLRDQRERLVQGRHGRALRPHRVPGDGQRVPLQRRKRGRVLALDRQQQRQRKRSSAHSCGRGQEVLDTVVRRFERFIDTGGGMKRSEIDNRIGGGTAGLRSSPCAAAAPSAAAAAW